MPPKGWRTPLSSDVYETTNPLKVADSIQLLGNQLCDGFYGFTGNIVVDTVSRPIRDVNGEVIPGNLLNLRVRDYMALIDGIIITDRNKSQFDPDNAARDTIIDATSIVGSGEHFLILKAVSEVGSDGVNRPNHDLGAFTLKPALGSGGPDLDAGEIVTAKIDIPGGTTQILASHIDNTEKKFLKSLCDIEAELGQRIDDIQASVGKSGLINGINIARNRFDIDSERLASASDMKDGFSDSYVDTDDINLGASDSFSHNVSLQRIEIGGVAPAGLQHHWKLNEGSGLVALDSQGLLNGALTPASIPPVYIGPGGVVQAGFGTALDFITANSNRVSLPGVGISKVYPFTIQVWFKTTVNHFGMLYSESNIAGGPNVLQLSVFQNKLSYVLFGTGGEPLVLRGGTVYGSGTWNLATIVSLNATDHKIYLNGVLDADSSFNVPTNPNVNDAAIGAVDSPSPCCFFNGKLDDIAVFNVAKNVTEINDTFTAGAEIGAGGGVAPAKIVSKSHTADVSPSVAKLVVKDIGSPTYRISRDNGTTFATVTPEVDYTFGGPAGTDMVIESTMPTESDILDNVELYWKV